MVSAPRPARLRQGPHSPWPLIPSPRWKRGEIKQSCTEPSLWLLGLFADPSHPPSSLFVQKTCTTAHPQIHRKQFISEAAILARDMTQLPSQLPRNKAHPSHGAGGRSLLPLVPSWPSALGRAGPSLSHCNPTESGFHWNAN